MKKIYISKYTKLHLFRRFEDCNTKQINCADAIEFLQLCKSFYLTPTFAKVDSTKSSKWSESSKKITSNVVTEELKSKTKQNTELKREIVLIYDEIRQSCSYFRYLCILKIMSQLRNKQFDRVMKSHSNKIA